MYRTYLPSPIGTLEIVADEDALLAVNFCETAEAAQESALTCAAKNQFEAYFSGELFEFDLPLRPQGTAFQQQVWQRLTAIPYAQTRSYKEIAEQVGRVKAVRAVGAANGSNPLAIIVPCHRVIGSDGRLTGYAGGLSRKAWLLEHEARHRKPTNMECMETSNLF